MKNVKKILIRFGYGVIGLCALGAVGWFMPFPIEGNWVIPPSLRIPCVSHTDCYRFIRFEDGKIMSISDQDFPPILFGTYQKKGWGKYETRSLGTNTVSPGVVHSTYLRLTHSERTTKEMPEGTYSGGLFRDFRVWTCRKAVNHPSNEWMRVSGHTVSDEKALYRGNPKTKHIIEPRKQDAK